MLSWIALRLGWSMVKTRILAAILASVSLISTVKGVELYYRQKERASVERKGAKTHAEAAAARRDVDVARVLRNKNCRDC